MLRARAERRVRETTKSDHSIGCRELQRSFALAQFAVEPLLRLALLGRVSRYFDVAQHAVVTPASQKNSLTIRRAADDATRCGRS